jgi:peroxiredoxin
LSGRQFGAVRSLIGVGAAVAATGAAAGACRVALRLTARYGRLLLRVEQLERELAAREAADEAGLFTLPAGMIPHDFDLPDLAGHRVTLSQWQGRRVLLIFFDPTCGFSRELLPDLAALPPDGDDRRPMPLLVSRGGAEANRRLMRAHGVRCRVLVQEDREVADVYAVAGSPMGYLIGADGRLATTLLVGPDALLEQAGVARPAGAEAANGTGAANGAGAPAGARAPRLYTRWAASPPQTWSGLPPGTPAPDFRLPRIDGGELALRDFRGRRVLLAFSDPACAPCDAIAPRLERLHRGPADVSVVMVSRGDAEANRAKAADLGLTFPIALQPRWDVSRDYGLLAAPVAYWIDEHGVLADDVAVGPAAIRGLLEKIAQTSAPWDGAAATSPDAPHHPAGSTWAPAARVSDDARDTRGGRHAGATRHARHGEHAR